MSWYKAGSITVTNGSDTIVGTNTAFEGNVTPGSIFFLTSDKFYEVLTVDSDTQITLATSYAEATQSEVAYVIVAFVTSSSAYVAQRVVDMLTKFTQFLDGQQNWQSGDPDGGVDGDGEYPLVNAAGIATDYKSLPRLIRDVEDAISSIGGTDVNLQNQTVTQTIVNTTPFALNLNTAKNFSLTLESNAVLTITPRSENIGLADNFVIKVTQGTGGGFDITWPASVQFSGGTPPVTTQDAGAVDLYYGLTVDGGSTFIITKVGENVA